MKTESYADWHGRGQEFKSLRAYHDKRKRLVWTSLFLFNALNCFCGISSTGQEHAARHHFLHSFTVSPHHPCALVSLVYTEPQSWYPLMLYFMWSKFWYMLLCFQNSDWSAPAHPARNATTTTSKSNFFMTQILLFWINVLRSDPNAHSSLDMKLSRRPGPCFHSAEKVSKKNEGFQYQ